MWYYCSKHHCTPTLLHSNLSDYYRNIREERLILHCWSPIIAHLNSEFHSYSWLDHLPTLIALCLVNLGNIRLHIYTCIYIIIYPLHIYTYITLYITLCVLTLVYGNITIFEGRRWGGETTSANGQGGTSLSLPERWGIRKMWRELVKKSALAILWSFWVWGEWCEKYRSSLIQPTLDPEPPSESTVHLETESPYPERFKTRESPQAAQSDDYFVKDRYIRLSAINSIIHLPLVCCKLDYKWPTWDTLDYSLP